MKALLSARIAVMALAGGGALVGCLRTPPVHYYTIPEDLAQRAPRPGLLSTASVRVAAASVPDVLDRPELVLRVSPTEVRVDDDHRWAEPLRIAVGRMLATNLDRTLGGGRVAFAEETAGRETADITVTVDVRRLDLELGRQVALEVVWTARSSDGSLARSGYAVARAPATTGGYDGLTAACAKVLAAVSDDISRSLSLSQGKAVANLHQ